MSLLDKINGKVVQIGGLLLAGSSLYIERHRHSQHGLAFLAALLVVYAAVAGIKPLQERLAKLLGGFAKAPAWPEYVVLALAAVLGSYVGGFAALSFVASVMAVGAGRLFNALY